MPIEFKRLKKYNSRSFYVSDCWDMLKGYAKNKNKIITRKHYMKLYHMDYEKLVKLHYFLLLELANYKGGQNV